MVGPALHGGDSLVKETFGLFPGTVELQMM